MMKSFPLSRTMQLDDYKELENEVSLVNHVALQCGGWHPAQHTHRRWEYALLMRAFSLWAKGGNCFTVGDFGCGIGLSPALMLSQECNVIMYEVWTHGNWEADLFKGLENLKHHNPIAARRAYSMVHRPLCELIDVDFGTYDISLCVSTLEHIGERERAFRDLCKTVKNGGLMFLTFDFAEHEKDDYQYAELRGGKMMTREAVIELVDIAQEYGLSLFRTSSSAILSEYSFSEQNRLVNDYGFASLVMVKEK